LLLDHLALAEFNLSELQEFALLTNDCFLTSLTLTDRFFEVLALLYGGHYTGLLDLAVKAAQQVL
jgi:hypothetical protein